MLIDSDKLKEWLKEQQTEAYDMDDTAQVACFTYMIGYIEHLEEKESDK